MKKLISLLLAMTLLFVLAACSKTDEKTPDNEENNKDTNDIIYAVESGSAGKTIAEEKNFQFKEVDSQADTLMEVSAGTSDAAIIDLLMAGAMIGEGTSYENLTYTEELTSEEYGIGCRKGSDLAAFINNVLAEAYTDGTMQDLAKTYNIREDLLLKQEAPAQAAEPAADGDVAYIQDKGTLVVAITAFEPMDYQDENGQWIGFDADMAKVVAEKLGVEIEFVQIDWSNKILELDSKNVDVVWNGMTLSDEVTSTMECTNPYLRNAQVIVVPK